MRLCSNHPPPEVSMSLRFVCSSDLSARAILTVSAVAVLFGPARAATAQTNLQFLITGINAEAAGIGDAGIGSSQAAFAALWNPAAVADAGLAGARGYYDGSSRTGAEHEVGIAHHIWVGATRTYGAGGRFRAGPNGGAAVFALATDTETETTDATYLAAGATYGRAFGNLLVGLTGKFVAQNVSSVNSTGFAVDVGLIGNLFDGGLRVRSEER